MKAMVCSLGYLNKAPKDWSVTMLMNHQNTTFKIDTDT